MMMRAWRVCKGRPRGQTAPAEVYDDTDKECLEKFKKLVENELEAIYNEALALLTEHLCQNAEGNGDETDVFGNGRGRGEPERDAPDALRIGAREDV